MPETLLLSLVLAAVSGALGIAYYRNRQALAQLRARFAPIVSADAEARRIHDAASKAADIVRHEAEGAKISAMKEARTIQEAAAKAADVVLRDAERTRGHAIEAAQKAQEAAAKAADGTRREAENAKASAIKEVEVGRAELAAAQSEWAEEWSRMQTRRSGLEIEYQHGQTVYEKLKAEVALLEENLEDISFGIYRPHFRSARCRDGRRMGLESPSASPVGARGSAGIV